MKLGVTPIKRIHEILTPWLHSAPQTTALRDPVSGVITYSALASAIDSAEAILQKNGVNAGDRVVVLTENSVATIAFVFAASRLDAWAVPINARLTPAEVIRIVEHATPRAVVCTVDVSQDAKTTGELLNATPFKGPFGEVTIAWPHDSCPEPVTDDQVAIVLYTTGTTGAPKGVMMTHANLLYTCKASSQSRGITPQDKVYLALPMSHIFGLASSMFATLYAGGSLTIESRFSAERLLKAIADGITVLPAVPQMHALLMKHADEKGTPQLVNTKLRQVSSGAAPLDRTWKRKAEKFYGLALQNGYGMTETTAGICTTQSEKGDPDISVGLPFPGVEVQLDTDGESEVGEILVKGPNVMKGYYRQPEETRKTITENGWLRTGDLGQFDQHGRLHIAGRSKELIIRSGFNVFPLEVEAALNTHPKVVQSAVIGRSVEGANEDVIAFVQVTQTGAVSEDELKAHAAEVLTNYKRPSRIILSESLPTAPSGKILKHKLHGITLPEPLTNS